MTDFQTPPAHPMQDQSQGYGHPVAPQVIMVEKKRNGMATASMVLGILALVFAWIPFVNSLSYILAAVAIGLGIAALVKATKHKVGLGMAIAGLMLAVASIFGATVVNVATVSAVDDAISEATVDADEVNVTFGSPEADDLGFTSVEVTVENITDETQTPWVTVVAQSADGTEQYDTTTVVITDLAPGQQTTQTATFTEDIPSDAEFVVSDIV